MPRPKKTAAAKASETATAKTTPKKAAEGPAAKASSKKEPVQAVEEIYLQIAGGEWNVSDCKKRAAAAFTDSHTGIVIEKLAVYLKPDEGKAYYVVNGTETGSIDL